MEKMTSRERVLTSLNHQEPDRVPLDLGGLSTTIEVLPYEELKRHLGIHAETRTFLRDHVTPPEELLQHFGIDTRYVRMGPPRHFKPHMEPDNSYLDEWGTRWRKPPSSLYFDPVDWPLKDATVEDLDRYPWPDPRDPGRTEGLRERAQRLRDETDCAIVADMPVLGIFETASVCLRGIERFMTDLLLNKTFASALLNKLADIHIEFMRQYLEAVGDCIDVFMVSDDLGAENAPLISPDLYREMVKPVQKRLWSFIKRHTDACLFMHTCGSVYRLIPDLIELGVDALNPIQVAARDMDTRRLKTEFGDRLTFWGGVDTQHVLPFGSVRDVEEEVRKRLADLAPGGGFVLTAVHNIQPGVPPENICMMYDAARQYGQYPITA